MTTTTLAAPTPRLMLASALAFLRNPFDWQQVGDVTITANRVCHGVQISPAAFTLLLERNRNGRRRVRIVDLFHMYNSDVKSTQTYHYAQVWVRTGSTEQLDQFTTNWVPNRPI